MKFSIGMLRKAIVRVAAIGLLVVLVAVIGLLVFGLPAGFIVSYLQDQIEGKSDFKLHIAGSTSLTLLPSPRLVIKGISLAEPIRTQERFKAEEVRLEVALLSLFRGDPEITEISVIRPTIRVPVTRRRAPSARAGSGSAAAAGPALPTINSINIDDGTVLMVQDGRETGSRIDHLRVRASWTAAGLNVALEEDSFCDQGEGFAAGH
jgi:AsmA protein